MDIEALTEEVMRRLLIRIQQEQNTCTAPRAPNAAPNSSVCCGDTKKTGKLVITQDKATSFAPGSKVTFPKGTIITPLARDALKERGVSFEFEKQSSVK